MTFSNCLRLIWMRFPFIISQLASGFSSASFRSFFSPIRKYLAASSMVSVYFSQIVSASDKMKENAEEKM